MLHEKEAMEHIGWALIWKRKKEVDRNRLDDVVRDIPQCFLINLPQNLEHMRDRSLEEWNFLTTVGPKLIYGFPIFNVKKVLSTVKLKCVREKENQSEVWLS